MIKRKEKLIKKYLNLARLNYCQFSARVAMLTGLNIYSWEFRTLYTEIRIHKDASEKYLKFCADLLGLKPKQAESWMLSRRLDFLTYYAQNWRRVKKE